MKKTKKLSADELLAQQRIREIKDIENRVLKGYIPKNPTRFFNVGDHASIGALKNITITEVLFEGMAYYINYDYMGQSYGRPDRKIGEGAWDWTQVFPISQNGLTAPFRIKDDVEIRYLNNDISSLLSKVYNSGVDFNPSYQRELVWDIEQKLSLIDSIFNNVEIGKFTFIKHEFCTERKYYYEILDGKQRLSTICEFYEDRILWNGKKFSELHFIDKSHFRDFPVIQGEVGEITEQQIYKLFIKMNTSGKPVSAEHLEKIKSLIK